ncbi:helix-turn-helix domain-containing protein [Vibrio cyclitrophicus]|uniref:helix-turn-helix domain-containing protein n=1 Tax=Vibrio cyclitrophicus TaxID=47951 RepID=UPI000492D791|nr:helix-turn-helix domain-containing protein [Vibrio cyclitrophicus]OEE22037.1 transcriptional regulator [Vibrio cyclitrophicus ZF14]
MRYAPDLCTFNIFDANEQAASLFNWQQEYDQLSRGSFLGQIRERKFSHVHIFREDSNRKLKQQCRINEGIWLGLSANDRPLHINYRRCDLDSILIREAGVDFELITPETFSIYGLVISPASVEIIRQQLELESLTSKNHFLRCSQHYTQQIKTYLTLLLSPSRSHWSFHTHQAIVQDMLVELFAQSPSQDIQKANATQREITMRRIKRYLDNSQYRKPITVTELCDAVYVSRRTLQYTFEYCCDISPKQFIQSVRLNQVRRILQNPSEQRCINEIAFDFGFFHLGHFCQSYKQLFGESPMQTRPK